MKAGQAQALSGPDDEKAITQTRATGLDEVEKETPGTCANEDF